MDGSCKLFGFCGFHLGVSLCSLDLVCRDLVVVKNAPLYTQTLFMVYLLIFRFPKRLSMNRKQWLLCHHGLSAEWILGLSYHTSKLLLERYLEGCNGGRLLSLRSFNKRLQRLRQSLHQCFLLFISILIIKRLYFYANFQRFIKINKR